MCRYCADLFLLLLSNTRTCAERRQSKLDATCGFWQIPLLPESARLTTFITPVGRFRFKWLQFEITSVPEIFQCLMTDMLKNEDGCKAIMDDIIVFRRSAEEQDENLNRTLQVIKESGLKLNKAKCEIKKDSLTYFGQCRWTKSRP